MVLSTVDLAAWRAFLMAHAAVLDVLERELAAAHDMTLSEYDVLVQLTEARDGRLRMSDLAASVLLSRSGLTRLVDRMERSGRVRREACPDDGRGAFAVVTSSGRQALATAWPTHAAGVERHFASAFVAGEAATLADVMGRVRAAAGPVPDRSG